MKRHTSRLVTALSVTATFALAACNDFGAPSNQVLSRAEADSLVMAVAADLDALPSGASYDVMGGIPLAPPRPGLNPPDCATREPNPPVDSDGDLVPDSVRITFDCSFSSTRGTFAVTGTVDLLDMQPTVPDHSIRSVFTDLTHSATGDRGTFSSVENGTRTWSGSSSQLAHSQIDFHTDVTFPNGSTASHVKDWTAIFTADVAGSIERRQPLPSGTFDVDGSSVWTHGDRTWSFSVATDPNLHYDAACDVRPKFDAGKVTLVVTRGGRTQTVTIEFLDCGQYLVTRS
jgi:hypothetical protein